MKLAVPVWEGRVSHVFDFARKAIVVDLDGRIDSGRREVALLEQGPAKIVRLRQLGVDTLICGAVSRPLASLTSACGIRLLPYVTGTVEDVIEAFKNGQLGSPQFVQPGCWQGARMGFRRRCGWRGRGGRPRS